jgi:hypothetical protein
LTAAAQQAGTPCADVGNLERPARRIAQHRESVTGVLRQSMGKAVGLVRAVRHHGHAISREKQASKK